MEGDEIGRVEQIYDVINDSDSDENLNSATQQTTGAGGKRRNFTRTWTTEPTADKRKLLLKLRDKFCRKSSEEFTNNVGVHGTSESLSPCVSAGIAKGEVADKRRTLQDMHHKTRSSSSWNKASASEVGSKRSRSKTLSFLGRFRDSKNEDMLINDGSCDHLQNSCLFSNQHAGPLGEASQNGALASEEDSDDPPPLPDRPLPAVREKLRERAQSVTFPLDRESFARKEIDFQKEKGATEQNSGELPPLADNLEKLSHYSWYWGPLDRYEAEKKLEGKSDGSFLVRDSFHEFHLYSVTFRSKGRTLHTRIIYDKGQFGFMGPNGMEPSTGSVVGLMKKTMRISQRGTLTFSSGNGITCPSYPIRFLFPFSRFEELPSLQHQCRFVIRQNSRCDKLHELPLPPKLIRYLQVENHYLPEDELTKQKNCIRNRKVFCSVLDKADMDK